MGIQIVRTLPEQDWRRFVNEHPQGNIFHTPEMLQVFGGAKGHQPDLWAAVRGDGSPVALLPSVQLTLIRGPLQRFATRNVAYGGILCAPSPEGEAALAMLLKAHCREAEKSTLFTELRNLSDLSKVQPILQGCGFLYEDHLNYLIDLDRHPETVLQSMSRGTRKKIRRGLRRGTVAIEEVQHREQLAILYELLRRTYASAQVPLADRTLFEAAFDVLRPKGMIKFLLASIDGDWAAGSIELIYRDEIYGWYSGLDRAYASHVPTELLMWHILRWGAENGYRLYDFGGAGTPDKEYGVRDFKAKFGGELVCFGRNTCVHAPRLLWLSQKGYSVWRRWL